MAQGDEATDGVSGHVARSGAPTLGYVAATRPDMAKAAGGVVLPTAEAAFRAIDAMGEVGSAFQVYEVLAYVASDPVPRPRD